MKKILIAFVMVFLSLNFFVACGEKKEHKTKLTKGVGRASAITPGSQDAYSWNYMNNLPEVQVFGNDLNNKGRAYLGQEVIDKFQVGYIEYISVILQLRFKGNQIDPGGSVLGIKFWDSTGYWNQDPIGDLLTAQNGSQISGTRNNNQIDVVFNDGIVSVRINGHISNGYFIGKLYFDQTYVGEFTVQTQGVIL